MRVVFTNSHVCVHKLCWLCVSSMFLRSSSIHRGGRGRGERTKNTVHNNVTSSNLKGRPMTKTIGLHWLQQVTKHVPANDEASVHIEHK